MFTLDREPLGGMSLAKRRGTHEESAEGLSDEEKTRLKSRSIWIEILLVVDWNMWTKSQSRVVDYGGSVCSDRRASPLL